MIDYKYSSILKMALPLMVSSFIQSIVYLTDAAFLSRYDEISFDAAGNAGLIYVSVFIALNGMADGAQILIARRIGQNRLEAVKHIFGSSLNILSVLAILFFCFIQFIMPSLLHGYSKHQDLASAQVYFISWRSFALFFAVITLSIQSFLFATGKTKIVLVSALITALSNVVFDYFFIFGNDFIPELGLKGAALASTLADGLGMLFLLLYLIFNSSHRSFQLFTQLKFQWKSTKELLKVGSPILFQGVIALSTWTVFFTWIEQIGKFELTVSQNIRAIYFLAFVPIWGFSATTKTYISQYLGKNDHEALKIIKKRIQLLIIIFITLFFHGGFLYPEKLIAIINPSETFQQKSGEILRFITLSVYIYGLSSVYFQTINGSGNTRVTFIIEVICIFIYILSAYYFIKIVKADIFWIWSVEYIYFILMGLLSLLYLRFFDWKQKKI